MEKHKIVLFFVVIVGTYFSVDLAKIYLAQQLKNRLTDNVVKGIKIIVNLFIVVCGLFLLYKGMS